MALMAFRALGSHNRLGMLRLTSRRTPAHRLAASLTTPVQAASASSSTDAAAADEEENLFGFDLPTNDNSPQLLKTRHTTSHVMAMAVQKLHKEAQVTIGPWIDNGFYYDFYIPNQQLSDNDLKLIKKEMDKIIKADLPLRREEVTREEAR